MHACAFRVAVLGAGAWGTAAACVLAARHDVLLWARDPAQAGAIGAARENRRYLPGVAIPPRVSVTADFGAAVDAARDGLVVIATPVAALAATVDALARRAALPPVVWLCKGFDRDGARLPHQVVAERLGRHPAGPLSGPSFAQEVALGLPAALTVAGAAVVRERATAVFHGGALRIYSTEDVVGVEVAGALKNVIAISTGISDALDLGLNARAALITRGLAEVARLGVALGARLETFMGLAGVGDLILTCTGDLSRNRQVGLMLGRGVPLAEALAQIGHVAEGVRSAPAVVARAREAGVDMPVSEAVSAVIDGRLVPRSAVERLLARDPRAETLVPGPG
ncbi:MAG TPA: NAD(P)H-dependent glycerol-3-phosphate dehydrogenase [Burkholderiaceae bacterium]|nr:NAD(P)H-dependent glycerol-3-phosphate dehydrogenase [Burkholderiaceae bacterium]